MIRAVVFDMDGVLVDAREWHFEALNRALLLFGYEISVPEHETIYDGLPTRVKLDRLVEKRGLPRSLTSFIAEMKQVYTMEIVLQRCKPNFIHEYALSRLKAEGYPIAVASNSIKESIAVIMEKTCLAGYLEFFLSNEVVRASKPDPEIYLKAAAQLGLRPDECLVVEDNHNGIRAARAAGAALLEVRGVEDVTYERIAARIAEVNAGQSR
jgi:HAD superfamily hydrolase (TIGR01549 family)